MPDDAEVDDEDVRLQHSLYYDSNTSEIKDDFAQLISCLVRLAATIRHHQEQSLLDRVHATVQMCPTCRCTVIVHEH